jgi:SNF2 family DNA or RNA helicase
LSGHLKANKLKFPIYRGGGSTADRSMPVGTITKKTFKDIEKKYRRDSELICSRLALTSGSGDLTVGGTTNNNTSLKGVLQRYYKESFTTESFCRPPPTHDHWEKISHHRDNNFEPEPSHHDFILNSQDRVFAALCLEGPARRVKESLSNAAGIIEHLENLGHNSELFCEGLKVELLAYQKQSLKWALERETVRGGIQRYFWTKVEYKRVTTNNKALRRNHLYFNPIFGRFKKSRPTRIHGGIIAEEMGLGKTVISLALILKNPAPMLPISGSNINSLNTLYASEISGPRWDQDRYGETSVTHPKRGSILSRGTLVICPVSLVGQWIEGKFL